MANFYDVALAMSPSTYDKLLQELKTEQKETITLFNKAEKRRTEEVVILLWTDTKWENYYEDSAFFIEFAKRNNTRLLEIGYEHTVDEIYQQNEEEELSYLYDALYIYRSIDCVGEQFEEEIK